MDIKAFAPKEEKRCKICDGHNVDCHICGAGKKEKKDICMYCDFGYENVDKDGPECYCQKHLKKVYANHTCKDFAQVY